MIATINQLECKCRTCEITRERCAEANANEAKALADLRSFVAGRFPALYERLGFPQTLEEIKGIVPLLKEANGVKEND